MKLTKAFGIFAILGNAIQNHRISHNNRSIAWAYLKVDRFFVLPTISYEYHEYDMIAEVTWNRAGVNTQLKKEWVRRFFFIWGTRAIRINYGCRTGFLAVQD